MKTCSVENCTNKVTVKGWCNKHYQRYKTHGDPEFIKIREKNMSDEELLKWIRSKPQLKRNPETRCKEWQRQKDKDGYGMIRYKGKMTKTHRLVWYLVKGNWPKGMLLHSCDHPSCINLKHLREGSAQDNVDDMFSKGREMKAKGERVGSAKLTEKQVIAIRKLYKTGRYSQKELALIYKVMRQNISSICTRRIWKHVK